MSTDPAVRIETLCVATGVALISLRRTLAIGKIPPTDLTLPALPVPIKAWRLSTLAAWNPSVAHRCAAILAALDATSTT